MGIEAIRVGSQALARTMLLLRDHIRQDVPDTSLAEALLSIRAVVASDAANVQSEAGQHAVVTAALLIARSGGTLHVAVPDVPLLGVQAPLRGDRLGSALINVLDDLIPGLHPVEGIPAYPVDLAIVVGDAPWSGRATRVIRLHGDAWAGGITNGGGGARWVDCRSPFGALGAAGLAAGEAFKMALGRLRDVAINTRAFDALF